MPTLLQWTSVGIGDLDVFIPSPPCLVVYTSYVDDEPESTVTFFWQDENTGIVHHELLFMEPVPFETALAWAQEHAPTRSIERIHVKHVRTKEAPKQTARSQIGGEKECGEKESTCFETSRGQKAKAACQEGVLAGHGQGRARCHTTEL